VPLRRPINPGVTGRDPPPLLLHAAERLATLDVELA
jgi:hypothetical protein